MVRGADRIWSYINIFLLLSTGGSDPRTPGAAPVPTKSVFVLDLSNKEWQKVSDLNVPRMSHCVCTLLGKIYAIGGNGMNIKYV